MTDTPFRVDILDAAGDRIGGGPLRNITSLNTTQSLDAIGSASFTMPAGDSRTRHFDEGTQFDLYDEVDGYLGRYWFKSQSISEQGSSAQITVNCYDALRELTTQSVKFRRKYNNTPVDAVIDDLISVMPEGWIAQSDPGIGNTTIRYDGDSVLLAIDALRDRWGQHYRLKSTAPGTNVLEFGAFGDDSEVRAIQGTAAGPELEGHREVAFITQIKRVEDRADIVNTVIPLGAGEGTTQLTIETADQGEYDLLTGTNEDGSSYYYIQDAESVAQYGDVWRVMTVKSVAPLTNSDANIRNAANALKLSAEAYLRRRRGLTTHYSLTLEALRKPLRPGDRMHVKYTGVADNYTYLDIDEALWVMEVSRSRNIGGQRSASVTVATDDARRTSDTDIMLDIMNDLNALKVSVPTSLAYRDIGPYMRRIDGSNTAKFTVRIKEEVLAVNRAILSLRTDKLKSSVQGVAGGGGTTETSSAGGGQTTSAGGSTTETSSAGGGQTTSAGGSTTQTSSAGGGIDVTSSAGGGQTTSAGGSTTQTSSAGGGIDVTSSAGGATTQTSSAGGGTTETSSDGGATTQTSTGGGNHNHKMFSYTPGTATTFSHFFQARETDGGPAHYVRFDTTRNVDLWTEGSSGNHTHITSIPDHTHDTIIPNHTHSTTIPNHTHTVYEDPHTHSTTIPNHTHTVSNHTHTVYEDPHTHSTTIPNHTHTVSNHTHDTTIPNHTHTVSNHTHDTTIPDHTHTVSNHTHDTTIPNHTHAMEYGLFEDTATPDTVRVAINSVDVTGALGGPWAVGGSEIDIDLDITDYIVNASGGLRQNHTITVSCDSGRGEVEAGVNILCSIQAIQVS